MPRHGRRGFSAACYWWERRGPRAARITALNQLFQKHLDERAVVVRAYRDILDGLGRLANQFSEVAERARAQPIPDLDELPALDEETP